MCTCSLAPACRVVLFSQFNMMLDIIEDYLIMRGYKYRCVQLGQKQLCWRVQSGGSWTNFED